MKKIPVYGIIGDGKLAKHLIHYFSLAGLNYNQWSRKKNDKKELNDFNNNSDIIVVLIEDSEIENFINQHLSNTNKVIIHCSGSLVSELAIGVHPLMSFSDNLYDIVTYKNISFVIDKADFDFKSAFPRLDNKYYYIDQQFKAYYHALCVMSGNFSSLLWMKLFEELEKMNIDKEAAYCYLDSISYNLKSNYKTALTGPISRGDKSTIIKNLNSLINDSFYNIYNAFLKLCNIEINNEYK